MLQRGHGDWADGMAAVSWFYALIFGMDGKLLHIWVLHNLKDQVGFISMSVLQMKYILLCNTELLNYWFSKIWVLNYKITQTVLN